jgi:hypothetical protein
MEWSIGGSYVCAAVVDFSQRFKTFLVSVFVFHFLTAVFNLTFSVDLAVVFTWATLKICELNCSTLSLDECPEENNFGLRATFLTHDRHGSTVTPVVHGVPYIREKPTTNIKSEDRFQAPKIVELTAAKCDSLLVWLV